jgi:hypothetical protein
MSRDSKNGHSLADSYSHSPQGQGHAGAARGWRCFRSVKHIYAQVIDDTAGHTVVAASSSRKCDGDGKSGGGNLVGRESDRQTGSRAGQGQRHQGRGVRPRRLSLSRPRESAGRGGP